MEAVYDLEVEDNHNFVANGLLVHNCHMLSAAAFNALLKTLEEPPERVVFVLATTDPQRVLPTIISRCQRFDYRRIPLASMVAHLTHIAQAEAIALKPEALTLVAQLANGGLRDAESLLDQLSLLPGPVTPEQVWDLVGTVPEQDLLKLLQAIAADNPEQLLDIGRQILNRGREPLVVLQNLASFYLNLLIARTAPQRTDLVAVTASTWQALVQLAQSWPINTILQGQQCLREAEVQLRNTTQPQLWLEVTLLGLLPSAVGNAPAVSTASAVAPSPMPVSPPPSPPVIPEPASPEESVAAVPSPSTPTPLPSPATTDLAQVWQDCLPYLSPAAQALLKVHGSLVHLDTSLAQIGMRSDPLLRMAQQHQADVEVALRRICQRPLQVKFILQMAMAPAVNPSQPVAKPESPQLVPVPSPPPPPKVQALPTPKPSVSTPAPVPPTVNPPSSPSPETETVSQPQDLHKAMERLAKNFEGQWIRAEDSDPTPPSEEHKPMITGRPLPPTLATDDEDIPF
ncbi:DNA polymerase III subunit gamma/tau [Synechocystis sp. LKSZ1]|uniref:DNA polymerase III subunit gamma/tau n=1 Tax=Synechocystis sp. LKSZ1 TaxID=3144951 RepID=UPI00336BD697